MSDEYLKFDIASIRARDEKYRTFAKLDKNDCPREDRLELLGLYDALAAENARLREALRQIVWMNEHDHEMKDLDDAWEIAKAAIDPEYAALRAAVQPSEGSMP